MSRNYLHNPIYYNIKALPKETKNKVFYTYQEFYQWFDNWIENVDANEYFNISNEKKNSIKDNLKSSLRKQFNSILNFMYSEDYSSYLNKFLYETEKLDKIRNQNFKELYPELYEDIIRANYEY